MIPNNFILFPIDFFFVLSENRNTLGISQLWDMVLKNSKYTPQLWLSLALLGTAVNTWYCRLCSAELP